MFIFSVSHILDKRGRTPLIVGDVLFVLRLAGVGLLGGVDLARGMESRAEQVLLSLTAASTHRLDDIIQAAGRFLLFVGLAHNMTFIERV